MSRYRKITTGQIALRILGAVFLVGICVVGLILILQNSPGIGSMTTSSLPSGSAVASGAASVASSSSAPESKPVQNPCQLQF